jgi:hypothetical protein
MIDQLRREGVTLPSSGSAEFQERTKGKVVAATVAASAAAVLFGGVTVPFGQRNKAPIDGYTNTTVRETVFRPEEALAFDNPAAALTEALRRKLPSTGVEIRSDSPQTVLTLTSFWGIDYEKLTEKDNYRLYYNLSTTARNGTKILRQSTCSGATADMRTIEAWMANDKADIKKAAAAIGDICADQFLADLGLASPARSTMKASQAASP